MVISSPEWSRIHQKEPIGPLSALLSFFSYLYGLGVRLRLWAYACRLFKGRSLPGFVVSIGNLTVGGTGKTPAVMMLARWAKAEGYRVAVLLRGYGGQYGTKVLEVSDGEHIKTDVREAGDESYLLAEKLSGIPVVVSKKRYLAGAFAQKRYGCDFFILDDGFQHLELNRNLNFALIDATNPFGNGHLLPLGPLREPIEQLERADAFILTRYRGHASSDKMEVLLKEQFPSSPVFHADHLTDGVVFPSLKEFYGPEFLNGKRLLAFAGIADPEAFRQTLVRLGADVVYFKGFRDHYQYKQGDIEALTKTKTEQGAEYIVTTEKDWSRISTFASIYPDLAYLRIRFAIMSGQDEFFKMIKDKMAAKRDKADKKKD